ncbi:MAG TPA: hypothetical protein VER55_00190 [Ardenticatenaceae bacterium]|nr:hypothetical protein [Ardenticatenaceae bacterium]
MFTIRDKHSLTAAELRNKEGLHFQFLDNGAIFSIRHQEILINQVLGSPLEGGIGNLYLRLLEEEIAYFPLRGPASGSDFSYSAEGARWRGSHAGIEYACTLRLAADQSLWFWSVELANTTERAVKVDVVLAQDLGIAHEGAVRNNELYTSQYIDHAVYRDGERGYVICSRQNQPANGRYPWIQHGCLDGAVGYLTDGFQFYGLEYRATNAPAALGTESLPNGVYQYEFALPTLRSRPLSLAPGHRARVTFYAFYLPDHPAASSEADLAWAGRAAATFATLDPLPESLMPCPSSANLFDAPALFTSRDLTAEELEQWFGSDWRHVEEQGGQLRSFFCARDRHVILKAKEVAQERPSGHIMRSGRDLLPTDESLAVTVWMGGIFTSHVTIGNTSMHKFMTLSRNPLNVLKASGQRLFVKRGDGYELLGLPSAFEVTPNSARWIYQNERVTLVVKSWTSLDAPACFVEVEVVAGGPLELLISHNVMAGNNEYDSATTVAIDEATRRIVLTPGAGELITQKYPEARFHIVTPDADGIAALGNDALLYADGQDRQTPHVVMKTAPVERFAIAFTGSVLDAGEAQRRADSYARAVPSYDQAQAAAVDFWASLSHGARLGGVEGAAKLNDLIAWYCHNAMIHYTSPHGLEQYSGAAWGLRDVCQGPVEFLRATRNYGPLREVLKMVYSHQFEQSGDWPQWFMFDRYAEIQAGDSHADIIHWPIKALCDYIEATGDFSILDEEAPYTDEATKQPAATSATIYEHTIKQIDKIERDCIPGTALVRYGHGDWEDTLQPANSDLREQLVSTWTVELAYQSLTLYRRILERSGRSELAERLQRFCDRLRRDFNRYLVKDGVAAGLVYFGGGDVDYFLHPSDEKTGISYRLLPMTRGVIAGLFTPEQAKAHLAIIREHLSFPDGVRLMNRPLPYRGGIESYFKRAETAANFGREIGLQYVHAHIRYIEAMTKLGEAEAAWHGLFQIVPITLNDHVPSALPRQSNCYFSSSDAAFADRYEAGTDFERVKSGEVGVKGGWRVYSSGPGIYLQTLICHVLGQRESYDDLCLDPVLPARADGLTFDREFEGKSLRYLYRVQGRGFAPRAIRINGQEMSIERRAENPYREGGALISRSAFLDALDRDRNVVEIFV